MYKARVFLALGTWIAILPFLGLPYPWINTLSALTGIVIMCFSYLLYKDYKTIENKEKTFDNFRENNDFKATTDVEHPAYRRSTSVPEKEE